MNPWKHYLWGYCSACHTFVEKRRGVSLIKGKPARWYLPPHHWEGRTHTKKWSCGTPQPYNPSAAAIKRKETQKRMMDTYDTLSAAALDANNRPETRAT